MDQTEVEILYTNYKGRKALRCIRPEKIVFEAGNDYHPEPQWLLFAVDLEDGKLKAWAMSGIHDWRSVCQTIANSAVETKPSLENPIAPTV